ncbi:MAG: hypothetical protein J5709_09435 [Bacteroidales bacterium]|nr:hypothetical protein [Bacteroidales bacterium]
MKRFISLILLVFAGVLSYAGNIGFDVFGCASPDTSRFVDSRDGNTYRTVKFGNQVWMAENLRYSKDIPLGTSKSNKPHVYNPNGSSQNVETYGLLYNWYAAETACPEGWHLPTVSDWRMLKNAISGDNVGSQLASKPELWNDGLLERSTSFGKSGFSVLPAGSFDGKSYGNFGSFAYFWTANEYEYYSGNAYFRYIYYNYGGVVSNYSSKSDGFSVRCVKD